MIGRQALFALITLSIFGLSFKTTLSYRCGKALTGKYGVFHSPGFPRMYRDFLHCTWTITVDQGFCIMVHFTDFDVEYYTNCTYDYVRLSEPGGKLGTYCGRRGTHEDEVVKYNDIIKSSGNRLTVTFHSDFSNEEVFRGFKAHYRATDINECGVNNGGCAQLCHNYLGGYYCSCRLHYQLKADQKSCDYVLCKNVILRSLSGKINSPEYPAAYPPHLDCSWKIFVPLGYRIVLEFLTFEVESHWEVKCPYDFLFVTAGRKYGPLCGTRPPANITSTTNSMSIIFKTDADANMKGFSAQYYSEGVKCPPLSAPVNGVINGSGFSFKDEVFFSCLPGYNLRGFNKVWCTSNGQWTESSPVCEPISCGNPGVPYRGILKGNQFTFKQTVRYGCEDFYEIAGEEELTCEADGQWSDEIPDCIPVCGNSTFANLYRQSCRGNIVGGSAAVRGSYPWNVYIKRDGVGICGGSLLNEYWVVTAAHCVVNQRRQVTRPHRLDVVLGLHNRSMENETQVKVIKVGQIFEHRMYNPTTFQADIVLLRLTEPAIMSDYVKPICLPDTDSSSGVIRPGARGVVAGWGRTSNAQTFPDLLQEVCLPVIATNTCRQAFSKEGFPVSFDMFCAGSPGGGQDVCKGDSGGGYIFQDPGDSRWFLGGLVSWGSNEGCALKNKYSVYLEVEHYLDWIESIIFR